MPRRVVSTLLIVAYVASQLAALPHAHGSQSEHDQRPYVHGGWLTSTFASKRDSGHGHGHHHHGHEHSHSHGNSADPVPLPPIDRTSGDHDDDCVYLPYALVATKLIRVAAEAGQFSQPVATSQFVANSSSPTAFSLPQQTALHGCRGEHCALYLTLRTLRI
jgi:hypothetical protein